MTIEELADALIQQQDKIDMLIGQNTAMRTAILALIASHPDKRALVEQFESMRETTIAKALASGASDSVIAEAERVLDGFARPWRDLR